ncbi:RxLR-like protein [Plasmopara halstedii]|uniref:RxLR-like protein n=1 Tax=Plasmopara halstedii TaxID=4781 RepID=A0A0P1ALW8_PLAHL|nr:RxLR-like protein [Plasmopara halstedii]CEG42109.1 RxLR-like protein [Plasmopara halstedii]|eukprot:XP_024578478.1 RxLR-like protein [Plasmopara halstedii]
MGRKVFPVLVAAALLYDALCAAAPRIDINVIARLRPIEDTAPAVGPVPYRDPLPAIQGTLGSFMGNKIDLLPCVHDEKMLEEGTAYVLSLCLLSNVTVKYTVNKQVEVAVKLSEDIADSGDDAIEDPVSGEQKEPPIRTILGMFRGWQIDPITLNYKNMVYDDGDTCMDNDRYSMLVELVFSDDPKSVARLYGLKKSGMCEFKASLLIYVPEKNRFAEHGIHTPGVVDISDATISLPNICSKMKCRYENITQHMRYLSGQINNVQSVLAGISPAVSTAVTSMALEASKNIYESAKEDETIWLKNIS